MIFHYHQINYFLFIENYQNLNLKGFIFLNVLIIIYINLKVFVLVNRSFRALDFIYFYTYRLNENLFNSFQLSLMLMFFDHYELNYFHYSFSFHLMVFFTYFFYIDMNAAHINFVINDRYYHYYFMQLDSIDLHMQDIFFLNGLFWLIFLPIHSLYDFLMLTCFLFSLSYSLMYL